MSRLPIDQSSITSPKQETYLLETVYNCTYNDIFPFDLCIIACKQASHKKLQCIKDKSSMHSKLGTVTKEGQELCLFNNFIWISQCHSLQILEWYHNNLQYAGTTQMLNTNGVHFDFSGLWKTCKELVCTCQHHKSMGKMQHGHKPLSPALYDKELWEVKLDPKPSKFENGINNEISNKQIVQSPLLTHIFPG